MFSVQDCDFSLNKDSSMDCLLGFARKCRCGKTMKWAINRNGETRCVKCDREYLEALKEAAREMERNLVELAEVA